MVQPTPQPKRADAIETAGLLALVAAFACGGWWLGGPIGCATLGLLLLGGVLVFLGNV